MASLKIIATLAGIVMGGGAIALFATNPNQDAYEAYAVSQLQTQLSEELCKDVPDFVGNVCNSVIDNNEGVLIKVVESSTTRQNYYLLSIYKTDLDPVEALSQLLPDGLAVSIGNTQGIPTYYAETIGVFGRFVTYKTEEQK